MKDLIKLSEGCLIYKNKTCIQEIARFVKKN